MLPEVIKNGLSFTLKFADEQQAKVFYNLLHPAANLVFYTPGGWQLTLFKSEYERYLRLTHQAE